MKDSKKEKKFEMSDVDFFKYKKFMCSKCDFYKDGVCTKKRIARICAKKGLRNKE